MTKYIIFFLFLGITILFGDSNFDRRGLHIGLGVGAGGTETLFGKDSDIRETFYIAHKVGYGLNDNLILYADLSSIGTDTTNKKTGAVLH